MNKTLHRLKLSAVAGLIGLSFAGAAIAAGEATVPYRSGGASVEEFAELNRPTSDYNMKLVLAAKGSGAYLADVDVTVRSLPSREVVLETRTEGPLLLAALPPGRYQLSASYADVLPGTPTTVTRVLQVGAVGQGMQKVLVHFDTGDKVEPESPPEFKIR